MRAQTIQIFLPAGEPRGIRQAEITTRTVRVFDIPRASLANLPKDLRLDRPGVYFLLGSDDEDNRMCYIGESDNVRARLKSHESNKHFWDRVLVAVSLTDTWTKSHISFLEHAAIVAANKASQYKSENSVGGRNMTVPEPLRADCEEYFETIEVLVSTLGYPILEVPQAASTVAESKKYFLKRGRDTAIGMFENGALTVFAGAKVEIATDLANYAGLLKRQRLLVEQGVVGESNGTLQFLKPHTFATPSAAAMTILGRSSNGWTDWKDSQDRPLADIRDAVAPFERGVE
jgi:hypothetical protein